MMIIQCQNLSGPQRNGFLELLQKLKPKVHIALIIVQVILVYDLLGNDFYCYLVIFGLINWIVQVEVLKIFNEVLFVWGREYPFPMEFGHG